jgi:hypothetical protein
MWQAIAGIKLEDAKRRVETGPAITFAARSAEQEGDRCAIALL